MIKCYFVDVKSISSTVPKSKFKKADIDRLADAILAADGLLRPLILQQTDVEKYTVIEGHQEYYAAVRAKEKDIKKAEMVNAFIIDKNLHISAIEQLDLLTRSQPPGPIAAPTRDPQVFTELLAESIDRLLPTITAAISAQLQPIVTQLSEHRQLLDSIKLELINNSQHQDEKIPEAKEIITPAPKVDSSQLEVKPKPDPKPKSDRHQQSESLAAVGADLSSKPIQATETAPKKSSKKTKSVTKPSSSIPVAIAPSPKIAKPVENKQAEAIGAIESEKSIIALNLINTLSQDDLTLRMQRSGVAPAIIKLIPKIIIQRELQPAQKFDTWEAIIESKIAGLTPAKVQSIIKKLK